MIKFPVPRRLPSLLGIREKVAKRIVVNFFLESFYILSNTTRPYSVALNVFTASPPFSPSSLTGVSTSAAVDVIHGVVDIHMNLIFLESQVFMPSVALFIVSPAPRCALLRYGGREARRVTPYNFFSVSGFGSGCGTGSGAL